MYPNGPSAPCAVRTDAAEVQRVLRRVRVEGGTAGIGYPHTGRQLLVPVRSQTRRARSTPHRQHVCCRGITDPLQEKQPPIDQRTPPQNLTTDTLLPRTSADPARSTHRWSRLADRAINKYSVSPGGESSAHEGRCSVEEDRPARDPGADNPRIPRATTMSTTRHTTCRPGRCVKLLHHMSRSPIGGTTRRGRGLWLRRGPRFLRRRSTKT